MYYAPWEEHMQSIGKGWRRTDWLLITGSINELIFGYIFWNFLNPNFSLSSFYLPQIVKGGLYYGCFENKWYMFKELFHSRIFWEKVLVNRVG